MRKLTYTFKTDTLFKMLFVEHQDLLKKLVAVLMGIPVESITQFAVQNPEMLPENLGAKFCRLDINMAVNGQRVDLEVQVCNEGDYIERVMFYWAKEFAAAIPSGGNYAALPRTMILSILDFSLFECSEYQSFFQPLEVTRHTLMSDKMGFRFFEPAHTGQRQGRVAALAVAVQGRDRGRTGKDQSDGGAGDGTGDQCVLQHHRVGPVQGNRADAGKGAPR